jgi:hypothetical protein
MMNQGPHSELRSVCFMEGFLLFLSNGCVFTKWQQPHDLCVAYMDVVIRMENHAKTNSNG